MRAARHPPAEGILGQDIEKFAGRINTHPLVLVERKIFLISSHQKGLPVLPQQAEDRPCRPDREAIWALGQVGLKSLLWKGPGRSLQSGADNAAGTLCD